MNAGMAAYVMQHRKDALDRFAAASARLPVEVHTLQRMVADNPAQSARANAVAAATFQASDIIHKYLGYMENGQLGKARALDNSAQVRAIVNRLNAAKSDFDQAERVLAIQRFGNLRARLRVYTIAIISITAAGIVITLLAGGSFGLRLVGRLMRLAENARLLGEGQNPDLIGGDDEIAALDLAYHDLALRLRREHRVASTLQRALLPQQTPQIPGVELSTAYSPAAEGAEIGGDWYDAFPLSDDLLAISVGDVSGSGLKAATIMGAVRQAIRTAARETTDAAAVLNTVNRLICSENWLVSAFFAMLDVRDGKVFFSSAGHPPPLLVPHDGEAVQLQCEGLLLGVDPAARFTACSAYVRAGDMLVLYTDGLVELRHNVLNGLRELERIVKSDRVRDALEPAQMIQDLVFEEMVPRDDSAVLTLRVIDLREAPSPAATRWTFDARDAQEARKVRREMVQFITGHLPHTDFSAAELIFSELAGNVAKHTTGNAELSVERRNGCVILKMTDRGGAFDYTAPDVVDPLAESGRGLFLVKQLSGGMRIDRNNGTNTVTVQLPAAE